MSLFEEMPKLATNDHGVWAEKYRPETLDDYICDERVRAIISDFIKRKDVPGHLLFHGSAGTGKTTLAKIITKNIPCDVMYVNASDNTGVDFVRDKIKPFAATMGFNDLKIVILDESDYMSTNSQASLRNLMETYSKTTRFILTCNYVDKIIAPLFSRTQVFKLEPPTMKDVAMYIVKILAAENIAYDMPTVATVVKEYYPDIRKIVNVVQQSTTSGKLELVKLQSANADVKNKMISILKSAKTNKKAFNEVRQLVNDAGIKMYEELYTELYNNTSEYANDQDIAVIIDISESVYQNAMVVDKEITFMACIAKLLKIITK
jgi:replication factor C small subunit